VHAAGAPATKVALGVVKHIIAQVGRPAMAILDVGVVKYLLSQLFG
jgi:hypothetical protein